MDAFRVNNWKLPSYVALFSHEMDEHQRTELAGLCRDNIITPRSTDRWHHTELFRALKEFFATSPGQYFVRLETRSPKDAWYQWVCDEEAEMAVPYSIEVVKRNMDFLRVSSADQCMCVLTHSLRVLDDLRAPNSVLLLPWRTIAHATEVRCFVLDGKLVAACQYYHLPDRNAREMVALFDVVLHFFRSHSLPYSDCSVDVHLADSGKIEVVEYNPMDDDLDTIEFEYQELLDRRGTDRIEFRYNGPQYEVTSLWSSP